MTKAELTSLKPKAASTEQEDEPKKDGAKSVGLFQLFRFADATDKFYIFLAIICSIVDGLGFPMSSVVFGYTIDEFSNAIRLGQLLDDIPEFIYYKNWTREDVLSDPTILRDQCGNVDRFYGANTTCCTLDLNDPLSDNIEKYVYLFALVGTCVFFGSIGQVAFWTISSERQTNRIRREFLSNILHQDIGWFDTNEAGELNTKLSQDIAMIQNGIGEKAGSVVQYFATFLAGYIIGFTRAWQLTVVLISVSPFMIGFGILFSYVAIKMTAREHDAYSKAGSIAEEILSSIRTVLAFGGEEKGAAKYDKSLGQAQKYGTLKGTANGLAVSFYSMVNLLTYSIGMWYGGKLIRHGDCKIGEVLMTYFAVSLGTFSLGIAAPGVQAIAEARGAAYFIFKLIDLKSLIDTRSAKGLRPICVIGNIRFKDVHFSYPSRPDVKILKGLNIDVRPGQTVALVGSSGCGKSTVVQLLQRFYDPHKGQVLLDGVDIKNLNTKWLRQHIGLVSQEPVLFATTIAENIRYGQEHVTMDQIIQAAKHANAYDFISKLPDQFNTMVGERGAQLSGGQKQRIAIARALVRDPKILLLDEATSALDTESEAIVQDALDKARQGRTTIVIAHRLSTIRTADIIIGLDEGVVKELGSHEQLMAKCGIYYTLVTNQTKSEEDDMYFSDYEDADEQIVVHAHEIIKSEKIMHVAEEVKDEEDIDEELPETSFLDLLRMNSNEWFFLFIGILASIGHGTSQPAFALVFSDMLKVFSQENSVMRDDLEKNAILMAGIAVGTLIVAFIQGWMFSIAGEALTRRLRSGTFKAMLRQEISWFDKPCNSTGALSTRLAKDASLVQGATGTRMGLIIHCFVTIAGALGLSFYFGWQLTLVCMTFFPIILFGGVIQMKVVGGTMGTTKETIENAGKVAVQAIENVRTVASLTKEDKFIDMYMFHFNLNMEGMYKRATTLGVVYAVSTCINHFAVAVIFGFGAHLVATDDLTPEEVLRVFVFIIFCGIYLGQSAAFGPDIGKATAAARRIVYILQRRSEINAELPIGVKPNMETFKSTVEFQKTRFSYPLRPDVRVLQGLNFKVEPGQTVALVGGSGCGKSTCISLLERFYDADGGNVVLGNHNLDELNIRWLRSQIGLVSQEPILFDCSIAENIAYGDNSRKVGMEEIVRASKEANIHNFVSALPLGYETNVGDKGTQLSGGQKQRIAIARALVRDPRILLLDEATSALDTESEKIVQEALDKAREGRTCITIAHRLSTIQDADKIVVIHHGEALEQGTHEELMALKGAYYRLQNAQNKG